MASSEPVPPESSPNGSHWTTIVVNDARRLATLAVHKKDYIGCMAVERTVTRRGTVIEKAIPNPGFYPIVGHRVLLGDFWPLQLRGWSWNSLSRVDAIVRVVSRKSLKRIEVRVLWVALDASPRYDLAVGKLVVVDLDALAEWHLGTALETRRIIDALALVEP